MNEKQTKFYEFYKQCETKGYRDMQDEKESLKAKVIATDLGIKYKDITKTYAEAKEIYEAEIRRVEHEEKLQKTSGKMLLKLMGHGNNDLISVYLREDGSIYCTHKKDSFKHEGAPALHLKSGGALLYTYHPSQAVYTGASSGGIHMGGVHHTKAYMDEKVSNSGKGYIEAVSGDYSITVRKIQLSDFLIGKFKRDEWYKANASQSGLIYCYSEAESSNNSFLIKTAMAQTDYYKRMSMISMAADSERLSMKKCKERIDFLNNALSGNYPASDEELYLRALSLENGHTSVQLKESIDLYNKLSNYKDSKERAKKLHSKYAEVLQHEKEQAILEKESKAAQRQKKAKGIFIIALVVIIAIIAITVAGNMEPNDNVEEEIEVVTSDEAVSEETEAAAAEEEEKSNLELAIEYQDVEYLMAMADAGEFVKLTGSQIQEMIVGEWNMVSSIDRTKVARYDYLEDGTVISYDGVSDGTVLTYDYTIEGDYIELIGVEYEMYDLGDGYYLKYSVGAYPTGSLMWYREE